MVIGRGVAEVKFGVPPVAVALTVKLVEPAATPVMSPELEIAATPEPALSQVPQVVPKESGVAEQFVFVDWV